MNISPHFTNDIHILSQYRVQEPDAHIVGIYCDQTITTDDYKAYRPNIDDILEGGYSHTPYNRTHNSHLIGLYKNKGEKHLVTVNTDDVTTINVILGWFGLGKLAYIDLSIQEVNNYLYTHIESWKKFKNVHPLTDEYKAYLTVCKLAGLQLVNRKGRDFSLLWKALSDHVHTKHGDFYINLACTFRHIRMQALLKNSQWGLLARTNSQTNKVEYIAPNEPMTSVEKINSYEEKKLHSSPSL